MQFWIDAVLFEFNRMTWDEWVSVLVGAFILAWCVSWSIRHAK